MNSCYFCGNKNLKNTKTEYIYKHNGKYLIVSNVPCKKCEYCGEKYFEANILKKIEKEFFKIYDQNKKVLKKIEVPLETYKELIKS